MLKHVNGKYVLVDEVTGEYLDPNTRRPLKPSDKKPPAKETHVEEE